MRSRGRPRRGALGAAARSADAARRARGGSRRAGPRGGARGNVDRRRERHCAAARAAERPTRSCSSTPSRRSAASRSRSTSGASTRATPVRRSVSVCHRGSRRSRSLLAPSNASSQRAQPAQSWYLDLSLIANYVSGSSRAYHHTAPVAMIFALHAALGAVLDEGLEAAWARHHAVGTRLQRELPELGFRLVVPDGHRLPELTTAWLPDGADDATLRKALLETYGIEVGGGLGEFAGKAWRIGLMGNSARERSVTTLLGALRELLRLSRRRSAGGSCPGRTATRRSTPRRRRARGAAPPSPAASCTRRDTNAGTAP